MYIDKEFLKNLVAISGELDFDIQYVEYSVENSCSNRNDISVRPYAEKLCDSNKEARNSNMKGRDRSCRNSDCNKESIGVFYDKSKSCNTSIQRRYINIEDVSDMKNIRFYHNLLEGIRGNSRDANTSICEEYGYINILENSRAADEFGNECKICQINDTYVWYDETKVAGNIKFISNITSKVNFIGYKLNEDESRGKRIAKAIAIFIE